MKKVFIAMLLLPAAAFIVDAVSPGLLPERLGWMLLFGSWPWSLPLANLPFLGLVAVILGFALNATLVIAAGWKAASWWLRTLRVRNDA